MSKIGKALLGVVVLSGVYVGAATAGNLYALVAVGQSTVDSSLKSDIDGGITALGATGLSSSLGRNDTGVKLQLGYQFTPNFSLEAGWVDLGKAKYSSNYTMLGVATTTSTTSKASGWGLSGVVQMPVGGNFSLYARLGLINAKSSVDATASAGGASASTSASVTKWKNHWGIGAKYSLTKDMDIQLEFERYLSLGDKNKLGAEVDVDLLSAGLIYKF